QLPLTDSHLGRIHFVAIKPEYQGKKLSKPLLSAALNKLIELGHKEVFLTTQTTSYPAINMYLNYGFEPYDPDNADQKGWLMMEDILNRKLNV
ncbi:GNAT family N-acetyltransferase, partial [Mammaliicoccus sciuri]|uniref:GNAT family N-acetyltransferase n=1 Tax=Mammaliicoccus sciuri TaxID=1296 RepID=UPI00226F6664